MINTRYDNVVVVGVGGDDDDNIMIITSRSVISTLNKCIYIIAIFS